MTTTPRKVIPVYTTRGDVNAFLVFPYLYNLNGEWIGFVSTKREVYSIHGEYVGWINDDPRILRKLGEGFNHPKLKPPPPPPKFTAPASSPLAPLMPVLGFSIVDVLDEYPELLPTKDSGELRPDLD
jgi:hypothetical protein